MSEPDSRERAPTIEVDAAPTIPGRVARWAAKGRILRARVEAARRRHASLDLVLELVEQDSTIGGGMLGGALAYRFFVFLLPFALFLVAGLGIYADTTEQTPSEIVSRSGLTALVASEVAAAASSPSRWAIFIVTLPILVYAAAMLYRAIAIVHAIAWHGSGRSVRLSSKGFAVFGGVFVAQLASVVIVGWIRRNDQVAGVTALLAYEILLGGAWVAFARLLPHRGVGWKALVPGAALLALGMLFLNSFNVYVTSRLVEERADTYGVLGVATALLFSLYIAGRVIVASAVLNATLDAHRRRATK